MLIIRFNRLLFFGSASVVYSVSGRVYRRGEGCTTLAAKMKGRKLDSPRHDQQSPAETHTYVDDSGPDTGQPWGGPSGKMNMQPRRGGYYFIKFTISAIMYFSVIHSPS